MIYYPIQTMVNSGITDILLVCGGNSAGEFLRILGNGEEFGLKHLHYTYQSQPRGIADALGLAEEWADNEPIAVILADNILENSFAEIVQNFEEKPNGARIFLTEVEHPEWYGVVELDDKNNVLSITEKPKNPKSNLIAVGIYMYDSRVWDYIRKLSPSARNELEITDLNNIYLNNNLLGTYKINGQWADCGESLEGYFESCLKASKWSKT